ncbi:MAG: class I SAM-dependent methyltransferase [Ignavibacteria bacterium]|nr:class I SAM-dependent methyltransferase [Ignavibacteria bacterium]
MFEEVYRTNFELEDKYWWFVARNQIVLHITNKITNLMEGDCVLDFGCGTGGFAFLLSKKYDVICLDPSPIAIDYCRKRGLNFVYQSTIEDFAPNDYQIKGIFALDVIEHIEDDYQTLIKLHSILDSSGWLILTVPAFMWLWSNHDIIHMHKRRYTKKQLKELLEKCGFDVRFISYFNFFLFIPAVIKRLMKFNGKKDTIQPVDPVPESLNKIFTNIFLLEKKVLTKFKFPFGLSLIAIAKK